MANKSKTVAATDDDFDKLFEGIEDTAPPTKSSTSKVAISQSEQDLLAELDNLASDRPGSRPHTPRISSGPGITRSPKRVGTNTPPPGAPGEDRDKMQMSRKSVESTRSFHTGITPDIQPNFQEQDKPGKKSPVTEQPKDAASGGGWWGGIFATATAAVKTAEAAVKEIQQNEEAKRWAEQVKGNVGALRGLGGELRQRALPTFTNILHTLAPPISSHERLQIHITHDFIGYPSLNPLIYQTFSRVMAQVEGGDLMVLQRGHEAAPRRGSDAGYKSASSGGWSDGPWWRQPGTRRNLGSVKGIVEGTKLTKVSAEAYAHEFFTSQGGVEEATKKAAEVLSESNPVRSSDIFLAIQAITHAAPGDLFGGSPSEQKDTSVVDPDAEKPDELALFAIYLHDPIHSITFYTVTQTFPQQWIDWLDASSASQEGGDHHGFESNMPDEIVEIINSGGVDPREWVAEWVEEVLTLGVGVVAQRYVARRMGVGEGGIGRGKAREEAIEAGAGEAARAI